MTAIGPGSWVRCVHALPLSEFREGAVYKVISVHTTSKPCNGPPSHGCRQIAFILEGVTLPACSTCFASIQPQGASLLNPLLGVQVPKKKGA